MLFIKSVEVINLNEDDCLMYHCDNDPTILDVKKQHIPGVKFIHPATGNDIVIAWSASVQEALSLPFNEFDRIYKKLIRLSKIEMNHDKLLDERYKEIQTLKIQMNKYKNMSFKKRLKFLFTRKVK